MKSHILIFLLTILVFNLKGQYHINDSIYKVALSDIKCENCIKIDTFKFINKNIKTLIYHCKKSKYVIEDYYSHMRSYAKLYKGEVIPDGKFYYYFPNNQFKVGTWKNGLLVGKYFIFKNNRPIAIQSYKKGLSHGLHIGYWGNGSINAKSRYKRGRLLSNFSYDSLGNIVAKQFYTKETYYDSSIYFKYLKDHIVDSTLGFKEISPNLNYYKRGRWKYYKDGKLKKIEFYRRKKLIKVKYKF